jgi:hypothetical protein
LQWNPWKIPYAKPSISYHHSWPNFFKKFFCLIGSICLLIFKQLNSVTMHIFSEWVEREGEKTFRYTPNLSTLVKWQLLIWFWWNLIEEVLTRRYGQISVSSKLVQWHTLFKGINEILPILHLLFDHFAWKHIMPLSYEFHPNQRSESQILFKNVYGILLAISYIFHLTIKILGTRDIHKIYYMTMKLIKLVAVKAIHHLCI